MPFRNLNVLDAAEQAATQVNALIDRSKRPPLLHVRQMRDSAQSVVANIAEGFGARHGPRPRPPARNRPRRVGGDHRHLKPNFQTNRLGPNDYRPLHDRYVVIVKMLNSLFNG